MNFVGIVGISVTAAYFHIDKRTSGRGKQHLGVILGVAEGIVFAESGIYLRHFIVVKFQKVKRLIERHRKMGWEFLFIGANIDAAAEAENLGIAPECAAGYVADDTGTEMLYRAMGEAVANVRAAQPVAAGAWRADLDEDVRKRGGK